MLAMSDSMAHTFVWKHDDSIDRKCEMLGGLVKAFIMAAFVVLGAVAGPEVSSSLSTQSPEIQC